MTLLLVAVAWMYVVLMLAVAEAVSPQGSVLGALFTLLLWGVLPLSLVLYVLATPARKRAPEHGSTRPRQNSAFGAIGSSKPAGLPQVERRPLAIYDQLVQVQA